MSLLLELVVEGVRGVVGVGAVVLMVVVVRAFLVGFLRLWGVWVCGGLCVGDMFSA